MLTKKYISSIKITTIILICSLLAIFINLYPHYYAFTYTPEGYHFSSQASWFDPWDINVYVATIRWGQNHGFLVENMYDSVPNRSIVYYPLYSFTGAVFQNTNPFVLFYSLSIITTLFLVTAVTLILNKLFKDKKVVLISTLIMLFAGGLGFLVHPYHDSLDSSMTSFTLHSAMQRPHEGVAVSLLIIALSSFNFAVEAIDKKKQLKLGVISLGSLLLTLIFYPYYLLSYALICSSVFVINKKKISHKIIFFFIVTLLLGTIITLLMQYNLSFNDSFTGVITQKLSNPTIGSLLSGFGVLNISIIYYLVRYKKSSSLEKYLVVWIGTSILLSFLPLGFARFFLRAVFFPVVILTVKLLMKVVEKFDQSTRKNLLLSLLLTVLILSSATSLNIFYKRVAEANTSNPWYFITQDNYQLLEFIDEKLPPFSSILSDYYFGNLIPAFSDHRVYFGHLIQTPDVKSRVAQIEKFYSCSFTEDEAKEFFKSQQIEFIIDYQADSSQAEEEGYSVEDCQYSFLEKIFSNESRAVFEINP